eukprot:33997-Amphidinium_carterae.1
MPVDWQATQHHTARPDRRWRTTVAPLLSLPSTKGRYRQCVRVAKAPDSMPQVAGPSPADRTDSSEFRSEWTPVSSEWTPVLRVDSSELRADSSERLQ